LGISPAHRKELDESIASSPEISPQNTETCEMLSAMNQGTDAAPTRSEPHDAR